MNEPSHLPVMVNEVIAHLINSKDGVYLDLTAGLGGHLLAFSKVLSNKAKLYGVDRDRKAVKIAVEKLAACPQPVVIAEAPYTEIDRLVNEFEDNKFDGVLLDLGVSSMQIDDAERGFSFRFDGPLDMRFDPESTTLTAADIVNRYPEKQLVDIFFSFGEERQAKRIAKALVRERQMGLIQTTTQLKNIILELIPPPYQTKSLARIFQALRIAVNGELDQLSELLPKIIPILKNGGRFAVLSYHSLEDRMVKRFFQAEQKGCVCPPDFAVCMCHQAPTLKILSKKALVPTEAEVALNSRARSVKMRLVEKL